MEEPMCKSRLSAWLKKVMLRIKSAVRDRCDRAYWQDILASWLKKAILISGSLARDRDDRAYWKGIFSMVGATCFAVAFVEFQPIALVSAVICSLLGLKLNRNRRKKP
jgi:hypothetical protein